MLSILRSIIQEVDTAPDLSKVSEIIVVRVKAALQADVCSIYLADFEQAEWVLMATDGLNVSSVGKVRLKNKEGLVGMVAERVESVNLENATTHPRNRYIEETGEERFHGFLGVPIIRRGTVLGVLVIQQQAQRCYSENEVDLLMTLASTLASAIGHAETHDAVIAFREEPRGGSRSLKGFPGAPGVAVGKAVVVYPPADLDAVPDRPPYHVGKEVQCFLEVVEEVRIEVTELGESVAERLGEEEKAVFDAYAAMVASDTLVGATVERIKEGNWAAGSLRETVREHVQVFDEMEDPYLRERANDVRDLGRLLLKRLQSDGEELFQYSKNAVLVGMEISAVQLMKVPEGRCVGIVSAHGSGFSHVAILARAMGIPAVMGVEDLPVGLVEGSDVIVDGYIGQVYLDPSPAIRQQFVDLAREEAELSEDLNKYRDEPSKSKDGHDFPLFINAGLQDEVLSLAESGAEGVGLYRTEYPFLVRDCFPGEGEQTRIYRKVLEACHPGKAVLRTLDIGGDKVLPYFPIVEDNPFLGWRGVRVTLDHPEIFLQQLRAMLRANAGLGNLQLMFPMISGVPELNKALALLHQAKTELIEELGKVEPYLVGVMIEVPSAVYQIEHLAQRVDFVSVGTNDLTQYLLAVDRNNEQVAKLYDHINPAVLRALDMIVKGARKYDCPVSICGEMAEDPVCVPLLMGLGVDSLSMSAASVSRIKWVIRSFNMEDARNLLQVAFSYHDATVIRFLMSGALEEKGLGGLVHAGR